MRNWVLITGVCLFVLATARLVLTTQDAVDKDVRNYINGLDYKFTARVDSAVVTYESKGVGFLFCTITSGSFDPSVEDSLGTHLEEHTRLRFIFPSSDSSFKVFLGGIDRYAQSDCVIVNSGINRFAVFRSKESVWEAKVSDATVGKVSFAFWIPD